MLQKYALWDRVLFSNKEVLLVELHAPHRYTFICPESPQTADDNCCIPLHHRSDPSFQLNLCFLFVIRIRHWDSFPFPQLFLIRGLPSETDQFQKDRIAISLPFHWDSLSMFIAISLGYIGIVYPSSMFSQNEKLPGLPVIQIHPGLPAWPTSWLPQRCDSPWPSSSLHPWHARPAHAMIRPS